MTGRNDGISPGMLPGVPVLPKFPLTVLQYLNPPESPGIP